jgi:hypothetical protein
MVRDTGIVLAGSNSEQRCSTGFRKNVTSDPAHLVNDPDAAWRCLITFRLMDSKETPHCLQTVLGSSHGRGKGNAWQQHMERILHLLSDLRKRQCFQFSGNTKRDEGLSPLETAMISWMVSSVSAIVALSTTLTSTIRPNNLSMLLNKKGWVLLLPSCILMAAFHRLVSGGCFRMLQRSICLQWQGRLSAKTNTLWAVLFCNPNLC